MVSGGVVGLFKQVHARVPDDPLHRGFIKPVHVGDRGLPFGTPVPAPSPDDFRRGSAPAFLVEGVASKDHGVCDGHLHPAEGGLLVRGMGGL